MKPKRERAKKSFTQRYGMTRNEWVNKKKELRKERKGIKVAEIMAKAYEKFLN